VVQAEYHSLGFVILSLLLMNILVVFGFN